MLGLTESACSDDEAIDRLLNPARNPYRLETLNVGVHAPIMRALQHANFTFAKKISHTADSQDQRHRMVPGSRPLLVLTDTRAPDFITPMLIAGNARAREVYERAMADAWAAKNELLDRGVPREIALYLLPNAKAIRLVESGSLLHLLHKWTMRTCFNAQEEIYQASMEEVEQVRAALPALGRYLGPPCYIRAGIATPICTEGSHFCGVKVWQEFPKHRAAHMTRRGSLVYYLAGWVCGSFFSPSPSGSTPTRSTRSKSFHPTAPPACSRFISSRSLSAGSSLSSPRFSFAASRSSRDSTRPGSGPSPARRSGQL